MPAPTERRRPWWKKLAWLVLLWASSVAALGVVSYLLRLFMHAAGLIDPAP